MEYPIKILLVDDRPDEFTSVQALLVGTTYELIGASSGMEALKLLLENEVALIVMDVIMPDMNGFETAKRIKMRKKSQDIPIIFLTSLTSELEDYMMAYSAGAIDYMTKPIHPEILRSKIEAFVRLYEAKKNLHLRTLQLEARTLELEETNRVLKDLKETAEIASSIKTSFLAMMGHEIRTPLNGILAMSEMLKEAEGLDEENREAADIIHTSGVGLLSVINHILDYSKLEAGKMELDHAPFDLPLCLGESVDLFRALARQRGLSLDTFIDPTVPRRLIGDADRLRQVLNNLIGNAIKFTESGGVKVYVYKRDESEEGLKLEFIIEDSGIGIPADKMGHLFQPFTQIHSSMTKKTGGTGLGLSICKTLVELMGGTIHATSKPEDGTMFTFSIQVKACPEE
ncbi:ATP-binding response regulator [Gorillibacterium sp. sgz500922]|uniref:ATP-binding response regulator n=1 Tax=Gorillibacterium sp. sgz500922 TaxID=3446694 RepID=UPI003F66D78A